MFNANWYDMACSLLACDTCSVSMYPEPGAMLGTGHICEVNRGVLCTGGAYMGWLCSTHHCPCPCRQMCTNHHNKCWWREERFGLLHGEKDGERGAKEGQRQGEEEPTSPSPLPRPTPSSDRAQRGRKSVCHQVWPPSPTWSSPPSSVPAASSRV